MTEPIRHLPAPIRRLAWSSLALSVTAMGLVVVVEGYEVATGAWGLRAAALVWLAAIGLSTFFQLLLVRRSLNRLEAARRYIVDGALAFLALVFTVAQEPGFLGLTVFVGQGIAVVRVGLATQPGRAWLGRLVVQPAKLLAVSFAVVIAFGAVFLTFPRATTDGRGASLVDATFTATSATCVTGLAVLNTHAPAGATRLQSFSRFGQLIILVLIQIGGLGIMTLSAAVLLLLGRRLGLRSSALLQDVMEEDSRRDLERSIRYIVEATLVFEAIGALILFFRFRGVVGDDGVAAAYAIFHSVSAYCNAGFALWGDSLTGFRSDPWVMMTVIILITLGGLGFTVIGSVFTTDLVRQSPALTWVRLPLHARIVLLTSLILVVLGTVVFYYFEYDASLAGLSIRDKLMASLFQSVTMRTAGFNTVDFSVMNRVTLIFMVLLMFVGGSSGSTAGGVKTSTVAVVFLSVRAMLLGREDVEVGGRTVPKTVVYKAISILVIFVGLLVFFFVALLWSEPDKAFDAILFESMSALATVGASTGITPDLTVVGKLLVTFLMFVGRIGPLTLALAVGERSERVALRYPDGRIMVG